MGLNASASQHASGLPLAKDGSGHLRFDERSFLVMNDSAYVDLGRVRCFAPDTFPRLYETLHP